MRMNLYNLDFKYNLDNFTTNNLRNLKEQELFQN